MHAFAVGLDPDLKEYFSFQFQFIFAIFQLQTMKYPLLRIVLTVGTDSDFVRTGNI